MRLPRKLKKGCRTLNGNPRTKWQRKGRLHIAKTLQQVADTACAAAIGMDLMRQAIERIHPVTFPSGGIVIPPPPRTERMMVGESTQPSPTTTNPHKVVTLATTTAATTMEARMVGATLANWKADVKREESRIAFGLSRV